MVPWWHATPAPAAGTARSVFADADAAVKLPATSPVATNNGSRRRGPAVAHVQAALPQRLLPFAAKPTAAPAATAAATATKGHP